MAQDERVREALQGIADIAVGHGDVCELIARRARAALLATPETPAPAKPNPDCPLCQGLGSWVEGEPCACTKPAPASVEGPASPTPLNYEEVDCLLSGTFGVSSISGIADVSWLTEQLNKLIELKFRAERPVSPSVDWNYRIARWLVTQKGDFHWDQPHVIEFAKWCAEEDGRVSPSVAALVAKLKSARENGYFSPYTQGQYDAGIELAAQAPARPAEKP